MRQELSDHDRGCGRGRCARPRSLLELQQERRQAEAAAWRGGGSSSAAGAEADYKIGFRGALSGDNAQLGHQRVATRVELAVDQANARATTFGFKVDVGEVRRRR